MMQNNLNTIGERMKFIRKSLKISQEKIAETIEVSTSSYKNYESDKSAIPHHAIQKFILATNTSYDFIFNGIDKTKKIDDLISRIRHNSQTETSILSNGNMLIKIEIPLKRYLNIIELV